MATKGTKISFYKINQEAYEKLTSYVSGAIYFVLNETSGKIYVNGVCYGEMNGTAVTGISFEATGEHANSLKVEFSSGDPVYVSLPEGAIYTAGKGINIENKVISAEDETLNEDLTITGVTVGNLADGKKISKGTSIQDLLKQMLTKELDYTSGTNPSVKLTGITGGTKVVGEQITGTLGYQYSDGTFTSYTGKTEAAGCVAGTPTYSTSLPYTVALGAKSFSVSIPYAASTKQASLKTNLGNASAVKQIPAGTATSATVTINGTYPVYATTVNASTLTQQPLVNWSNTAGSMESKEMKLVASTPEAPRKFSTPRKATLLQQLNTLSGKYEEVALASYDMTTEDKTFGETTQTYYTYTFAGTAEGAVTLKVKF